MPVEIRVPPLGESLNDAVVGQWLKSEGDAVSRGETLLELETDKVNLDVTAPEDGVLGKIEHHEGDVVKVGDLLAVVGEGSAVSANGKAENAAPVAAAQAAVETPAPVSTPPAAPPAAVAEQAMDGVSRAAPAVRRLAEEHAVSLAG